MLPKNNHVSIFVSIFYTKFTPGGSYIGEAICIGEIIKNQFFPIQIIVLFAEVSEVCDIIGVSILSA